MDQSIFLIVAALIIGVILYRRQKRERQKRASSTFEQIASVERTSKHIDDLLDKHIQVRFLAGDPPDIAMRRNEKVICVLPNTTLQAPRAIRRTVYGGPSIRLAKGFWWRIGQSTGESDTELRPIDVGTFVLTTQRIIFVGSHRIKSTYLEKVISIEPYTDGLVVHREGKEISEAYLLDTKMKMNYQYDDQTLQSPIDGRLIKRAIDVAVFSRNNELAIQPRRTRTSSQ